MPNKKFGMLRGLKDIMIVKIDDTAEGYTMVGTPEQLLPAGELTVSKTIDKSQYYFDDNLYDELGVEKPSEMSLVGAAIRAAFEAWIEGKIVDTVTGAIIDDGDWHNNFYAISGTKSYSDGTDQKFWFLKCSFNGAEESSKTKDPNSTEELGSTLPFTAYPTTYIFENGAHAKVVRIDSADTSIVSGQNWNAQVVTPDNLSDICQAVTPVTPVTPDDGE